MSPVSCRSTKYEVSCLIYCVNIPQVCRRNILSSVFLFKVNWLRSWFSIFKDEHKGPMRTIDYEHSCVECHLKRQNLIIETQIYRPQRSSRRTFDSSKSFSIAVSAPALVSNLWCSRLEREWKMLYNGAVCLGIWFVGDAVHLYSNPNQWHL